ncbi:MAG: pyridoxal-phosphate dependent enzyme [Crocinitomicaceae bacterium]|nr:pyridoxal-phosphate dependent enzyme [Crocinitomicaceae bacterium]
MIQSLQDRGIKLLVKRDDLIDDQVSGNKWRKLKFNVELCKARKNEGILTFGGAYSNHLIATASACNRVGLKSIGIVRGDELNPKSNDTLSACHELGMKLIFVSRQEYLMKNEKAYHEHLSMENPNFFIVPEGGANYYGIIGCQEIIKEIDQPFDAVFVAQGTSTTSCGIASCLSNDQKLHVVPALKGYDSIGEMRSLFSKGGLDQDWIDYQMEKVIVHSEGHFGGYGKYTAELLAFIQTFYQEHHIKLDPIYTGKAMYTLLNELQSLDFDNKTIVFIHTGGIQGSKSIIEKTGVNLYG